MLYLLKSIVGGVLSYEKFYAGEITIIKNKN